MNQPDPIDVFLRDQLINWALDDHQHPVKQATLVHMSDPNWLSLLYKEKEVKRGISDNPITLKVEKINRPVSRPIEAFIEEEWIQELLKRIHYALKKTYYTQFNVQKWGMRRINTTGMYVLGPLNDYGDIFFRFKVGVKQGIVYWDLENYRGKIRPKGFEGVPRVLLSVLEEVEHDFLIRKISKGFGVMHHSGTHSKQLLQLLLQLKAENIGIGSDAHGGMWIQEGKKKCFRLDPTSQGEVVAWRILDKTSGKVVASFSTKEEMLSCIQALNIPKTYPRKKQC